MMTNKKLLEEINMQSQIDNENLREQLREQLSSISKSNSNFAGALSEQIENCRKNQNELSQQINDKIQNLYQFTDKNNKDYAEKLEAVRKELSDKIDQQSNYITRMNKVLYDSIVSVQKDTEVIMQTLQVILTNMLLNDVKTDAPKAKYQNSWHEKAEEVKEAIEVVAETASDDSWKIKKPNRKKYGY